MEDDHRENDPTAPSEIERVIESRIRENVVQVRRGDNNYPGGIEAWTNTLVEMSIKEINQYLGDPDDVRVHLQKLEARRQVHTSSE